VAAAGPAEADRPLVTDQRAAAVGQDWRARGETCPILLVLASQGASDAAPVRGDGNPSLWVIECLPYNAGSISYKVELHLDILI
jgi:hypothetical protein